MAIIVSLHMIVNVGLMYLLILFQITDSQAETQHTRS